MDQLKGLWYTNPAVGYVRAPITRSYTGSSHRVFPDGDILLHSGCNPILNPTVYRLATFKEACWATQKFREYYERSGRDHE